jgi:O6-methylguanine-DNA--protein-cysteine methyltransferase
VIPNTAQPGIPAEALVAFLDDCESALARLRRSTIATLEFIPEHEPVVLRGDRQEEVARLSQFFSEAGLTASEVARELGHDEANTYTVLKSLERAGLLEVVEGTPRRWRYAEKVRRDEVMRAGLVLREGEWASYGDVSIAVYGNKGGARAVGRIAATNPAFPNAYRVLDRNGKIRPDWKGYGGGPERCRELLETEGISFRQGLADPGKRISYEEIEKRLNDSSLPGVAGT